MNSSLSTFLKMLPIHNTFAQTHRQERIKSIKVIHTLYYTVPLHHAQPLNHLNARPNCVCKAPKPVVHGRTITWNKPSVSINHGFRYQTQGRGFHSYYVHTLHVYMYICIHTYTYAHLHMQVYHNRDSTCIRHIRDRIGFNSHRLMTDLVSIKSTRVACL